jgi:sn-glycerol 3-phosphate transport system permease protein
MADSTSRSSASGSVQVLPRGPLGLTGPQRREIKTFLKALLYLSPALIIFIAFVFIPLLQSVKLSTFLTDPLGRAVKFVGLLQYQRLFQNDSFINSLTRSVQFVIYTVPTTLVVSMALALLGNLRLRRIDIFRMIFSITIAVSGATAALIFTYLYHPALGWLNYIFSLFGVPPVPWLISDQTALLSVALTTVWLQLGLNTVIILAGMQGISDELYESAMIDGATSWSKFRHITLPLLSPTLFFLLIVDTLAAFQVFTQIDVMTSGGPMDSTNVLVYSIYREFYFNGKYGFAAAQSIMLFFIILALTVVQFGVVEKRVHYE